MGRKPIGKKAMSDAERQRRRRQRQRAAEVAALRQAVQEKRRQRRAADQPPLIQIAPGEGSVADVLAGKARWSMSLADGLDFVVGLPAWVLDLIFFSQPYEDKRSYGGLPPLVGEAWVARYVEIFQAGLRACKGLVACVCEGKTKDYRWSAVPMLLMADLHRKGVCLRKPAAYVKYGIPGGSPDWWRNDWEPVICATNGGRLPWSDPTAMGSPPKYPPGGDPSHQGRNGRVKRRTYTPPDLANPGNVIQQTYTAAEVAELLGQPSNVIDCGAVGSNNIGDPIAHENEAPFPELLAEWFVRSYCPPRGIVCDLFSGSGTTGAVAVRHGRRFIGCDLRASQVELSRRRIAAAEQDGPRPA
jgi:hypothetical protein